MDSERTYSTEEVKRMLDDYSYVLIADVSFFEQRKRGVEPNNGLVRLAIEAMERIPADFRSNDYLKACIRIHSYHEEYNKTKLKL